VHACQPKRRRVQRADDLALLPARCAPDSAGVYEYREEMVPAQPQAKAGAQPQITAMAGPTMGCRAGYGSENWLTPEDELLVVTKIHTIFKFMCGLREVRGQALKIFSAMNYE